MCKTCNVETPSLHGLVATLQGLTFPALPRDVARELLYAHPWEPTMSYECEQPAPCVLLGWLSAWCLQLYMGRAPFLAYFSWLSSCVKYMYEDKSWTIPTGLPAVHGFTHPGNGLRTGLGYGTVDVLKGEECCSHGNGKPQNKSETPAPKRQMSIKWYYCGRNWAALPLLLRDTSELSHILCTVNEHLCCSDNEIKRCLFFILRGLQVVQLCSLHFTTRD